MSPAGNVTREREMLASAVAIFEDLEAPKSDLDEATRQIADRIFSTFEADCLG
jgi:hypothetical protein